MSDRPLPTHIASYFRNLLKHYSLFIGFFFLISVHWWRPVLSGGPTELGEIEEVVKYQDVIIAVTTIQYTVNSSQPPLELKPVWALSSLEILWPGHIEGLDCINVVLLIRFPWQECEKRKLSAARADFGCSSSVFLYYQ